MPPHLDLDLCGCLVVAGVTVVWRRDGGLIGELADARAGGCVHDGQRVAVTANKAAAVPCAGEPAVAAVVWLAVSCKQRRPGRTAARGSCKRPCVGGRAAQHTQPGVTDDTCLVTHTCMVKKRVGQWRCARCSAPFGEEVMAPTSSRPSPRTSVRLGLRTTVPGAAETWM